jgi:Immunity protein 8
LHSPDADPLPAFAPEDPESFGVLVQAMVGPAGAEEEESFGFTVCTPRWFGREPFPKGFAWPRAHLFVDRWDYAVVERAIGDLCAHSEGSDWNEVAARLACYGHWELDR